MVDKNRWYCCRFFNNRWLCWYQGMVKNKRNCSRNLLKPHWHWEMRRVCKLSCGTMLHAMLTSASTTIQCASTFIAREIYFLGRQEVRTLRRNTTFISGDWLCAVLIDRWVVVVEICRFFMYIQIQYWEWAFHSRVKWKQQQHWVGGELSEDDYTHDHEERRSWWQSMTCLWNGPRRITQRTVK